MGTGMPDIVPFVCFLLDINVTLWFIIIMSFRGAAERRRSDPIWNQRLPRRFLRSLLAMTQTIYTVKQLSSLAGISPRTLHYYDLIGLLKSESRGRNGYRQNGDESLLKLQQILFYRELSLSLEAIKVIVTRPDFDVAAALESHRAAAAGRADRAPDPYGGRYLISFERNKKHEQESTLRSFLGGRAGEVR
jgi:DNA-binding transcriptional MerR regulator